MISDWFFSAYAWADYPRVIVLFVLLGFILGFVAEWIFGGDSEGAATSSVVAATAGGVLATVTPALLGVLFWAVWL